MVEKKSIMDKLDIEEMLQEENPLVEIRKEARKRRGLESGENVSTTSSGSKDNESQSDSVVDHYTVLENKYVVKESGEYVNVSIKEGNKEWDQYVEKGSNKVSLINEKKIDENKIDEKKFVPKKVPVKEEKSYYCC